MEMRFFIFPIENIYIAVAADKVKRFISPDNNCDGAVNADQIKIPVYMIFGKHRHLENMPCHGIVLKQEGEDGGNGGNKTFVIITPPVERDIDVAEKEIQNLPGSFSGIYSSFNGLYFSGQKIIFFLDIEKLISLWLNKSEHERLVSG